MTKSADNKDKNKSANNEDDYESINTDDDKEPDDKVVYFKLNKNLSDHYRILSLNAFLYRTSVHNFKHNGILFQTFSYLYL